MNTNISYKSLLILKNPSLCWLCKFQEILCKGKELKVKLLNLIGKKVKHISIDSFRMDVRLELEEGYILEIFTQAKEDQWQICRNDEIILS